MISDNLAVRSKSNIIEIFVAVTPKMLWKYNILGIILESHSDPQWFWTIMGSIMKDLYSEHGILELEESTVPISKAVSITLDEVIGKAHKIGRASCRERVCQYV